MGTARLLLVAALLAACGTSGKPVAVRTTVSPSPLVTTVPPLHSAPPSLRPLLRPSSSPTRSVAPSPTPARDDSGWTWSARRVTASDLPHSWHPGCPVAPSSLRLLTLPYRDFDGVRRTGKIVVNARVVGDAVVVFRSLYAERFPIRSLRLVDDFGGSDDRSMAADNTSGFNCRDAVGGSSWSQHAYGLAIDVNPVENPYLYGGQVLPPAGAAYTDRSRHRRGMAYRGSSLNRAFSRFGWGWGGGWHNPDYQHFSTNGK